MSKISELSDGGSLVSTDFLIAVRSGGNVKVQMDTINVDQVDLGDNEFIRLGNSQDLTLVHTSTQSIINQAGVGDLLLQKAGATKLTINSTGIDITGTATADAVDLGVTTDAATVSTTASDYQLQLGAANSTTGDIGQNISFGYSGTTTASINTYDAGSSSATGLAFFTGTSSTLRRFLDINSGGDISFYENTGTNVRFFFDSSAERLVIGDNTVSPASDAGDLVVGGSTGNNGITIGSATTGSGSLRFADTGGTGRGIVFYDHSSDFMSFHTAGTEKMRLSGATVGIGVTPNVWSTSSKALQIGSLALEDYTVSGANVSNILNNAYRNASGNVVYIESDFASSYGQYNGEHSFNVAASGTAGATISFTRALTIDASGNLLVGKPALDFDTAGIELRSTDVISVTRSANPSLNVNRIGSSAGPTIIMHYNSTDVGSIDVTASATSYTTSSDERLKENIADADDAGSKVDAIQVRKFDWKVDGSHQDYGMVAQELQAVAPEAVSAPEDPEDMMGVDYSKLVPMMLKEIQSLRARVAQLES